MCSIRRHRVLLSLWTYWRPIWCRHITVEQLEVTPRFHFQPNLILFKLLYFIRFFFWNNMIATKAFGEKKGGFPASCSKWEMRWESLCGAGFTCSAAWCRTCRGHSFLWLWVSNGLLYLLTGERPLTYMDGEYMDRCMQYTQVPWLHLPYGASQNFCKHSQGHDEQLCLNSN